MTVVGTRQYCRAEFRTAATPENPKPDLVDPTTITLRVKPPVGATITPPVTRISIGVFTATFTPDAAGTWVGQWISTGTHEAASEEFTIKVKASL